MSINLDITAEALRSSGFRVLHAGDDYEYKFSVTRGGAALPLTGAKLWVSVKEASVQDDNAAKLQLTSDSSAEIEIVSETDFVVKFSAASTADLEGLWLYDIQVLLADGSILTLASGAIEFLANVTRSIS